MERVVLIYAVVSVKIIKPIGPINVMTTSITLSNVHRYLLIKSRALSGFRRLNFLHQVLNIKKPVILQYETNQHRRLYFLHRKIT